MAAATHPRIPPLEPPYAEAVQEFLERWMAPASDREPLRLFRVLATHAELASAMGVVGALILGNPLVDPREREIVIHRTTARCGAEYEWGVHAVVFGARLGLSDRRLAATVRGGADDAVWSEREALLVRLSDELHDGVDVTDELWRELERHWTHPQLLELIVTAGWYRLISQIVVSTRIEAEPWAARFPAPAESAPFDASRTQTPTRRSRSSSTTPARSPGARPGQGPAKPGSR